MCAKKIGTEDKVNKEVVVKTTKATKEVIQGYHYKTALWYTTDTVDEMGKLLLITPARIERAIESGVAIGTITFKREKVVV